MFKTIEISDHQLVPKYSLDWAKACASDGKDLNYLFFWGHTNNAPRLTKVCFSQWWRCGFKVDGRIYNCAEQYMMAEKARIFGDMKILQAILQETDQKTIKGLGRKVRNFDEAIWDKLKYAVVIKGNYHKFSQNKNMRDFLLKTEDAVIVEASPYDRIWGIGLKESDLDAQDPFSWRGKNLLGFALMEVRDELR